MYASQMGGYGMDRWHDGGAGPWLGLLMMVAVAVAIGLAVWLLLNRRGNVAHVPPAPMAQVAPPVSPTANAEGILAERLARSEITPDDYRAMLAALREQPAP
jgi:uncharacterized membrane protein